MAMIDALREAVENGQITVGQAEQVLGYQLLTAGQDRQIGHRQLDWRRRRLIAETGFVLADGAVFDHDVEVDLADVLEEAMESDAWERQG